MVGACSTEGGGATGPGGPASMVGAYPSAPGIGRTGVAPSGGGGATGSGTAGGGAYGPSGCGGCDGGASMVGEPPAGRSEAGGVLSTAACCPGPDPNSGPDAGSDAGSAPKSASASGSPSRAASAAIAAAPASWSHCGGLSRKDVASTGPGAGLAAPAGLAATGRPYTSS